MGGFLDLDERMPRRWLLCNWNPMLLNDIFLCYLA